jgi:hypothetical protein
LSWSWSYRRRYGAWVWRSCECTSVEVTIDTLMSYQQVQQQQVHPTIESFVSYYWQHVHREGFSERDNDDDDDDDDDGKDNKAIHTW